MRRMTTVKCRACYADVRRYGPQHVAWVLNAASPFFPTRSLLFSFQNHSPMRYQATIREAHTFYLLYILPPESDQERPGFPIATLAHHHALPI